MIVQGINVSKTNGIKKIVDEVSFTIEENDKIAVVGLNGIGKSTLLKMIAKKENYDGKIIYKKDLKISYMPQDPLFDRNKTIKEIINECIDEKIEDYQINSILNKFNILDYSAKINTLSGGQLKRIALAITLLKPAELLILDEPTNHLDSEMIEYLEKYLIKYNKAIFMVTHDRYFLERVCNKIYEIDNTKLYEYEGDYSIFLEKKQQREENALLAEAKRKRFLSKEIEWVRAGVQARTTKSKERLRRFEELSQIEDIKKIKSVEMIDTSSRLGKKTIELVNISKSYEDKILFKPFSYMFKRFDRIGVIGSNGVGKSTLLNIISGNLKPDTGEVIIGDTIRFAYFKQGVSDMDFNKRVIDYIKDSTDDFNLEGTSLNARLLCERFLFDGDAQYNTISRLSGGERRRLYLLKVLLERPNVLILDEPTNDLDIETLQILEDYLDEFKGIVIVVSHDRYFLDRICDGMFVIQNEEIEYINGGYSAYLDLTNTKVSKKSKPVIKNDNKIKMSYKDKKELEGMEDKILNLEANIDELENQMNNLSDYQAIKDLSDKINNLHEELDNLNNRWLELLELEEKSK